jgi:aldehyde:ferredoxin oxidoreductase
MVLEREDFEKLKDEYYGIRGWDVPTGLQTKASLEALDLGDVAEGLAKRELLG